MFGLQSEALAPPIKAPSETHPHKYGFVACADVGNKLLAGGAGGAGGGVLIHIRAVE